MIKKIIPREIQQSLILAIAIFVFLLFWGGKFIYGKSIVRLKKYSDERKRLKLENEVGNKLNQLIKIREEMKVVTESSRFLSEVAKLAGQMNMKLSSIAALPADKRKELVSLGVSLELDTTYHELGLFISKVESSDLFMSVQKMEIVSNLQKENAEKPRIIAKLVLNTLTLNDTILEK
ncbi:MAG: type 4a pilus biogenesis protein PilO [Candidatus Omnitrophica bacterium]|nr:type 4a pilus biogenesis protein PilO [Candidatus Omnitrophota bacterium]